MNSKRELIEPHDGDERYVRGNSGGQFNKQVDRGLGADQRQHSKTKAKPGQGDRGDC